ncbi:MAG: hypothetical protein L0170_18380 [Acidobacteria bacterium]|nr:hypothetical protein [Acidobacteriota bacterium]
MAIPNNDAQLREEGYSYNFTSLCRAESCKAKLEFWHTPKGKNLPFDRKSDGTLEPHFASCPEAQKFRKALQPLKPNLVKCLTWLTNELRRMSGAGEDRRFEDAIKSADRALKMAKALPEAK